VTAPVIYLKWLDSCGHTSHWTPLKSLEFPRGALEHESVGFLLKETDYSVVIAQSKGLNLDIQNNVDGVMEIPKVAITERRDLIAGEPPL